MPSPTSPHPARRPPAAARSYGVANALKSPLQLSAAIYSQLIRIKTGSDAPPLPMGIPALRGGGDADDLALAPSMGEAPFPEPTWQQLEAAAALVKPDTRPMQLITVNNEMIAVPIDSLQGGGAAASQVAAASDFGRVGSGYPGAYLGFEAAAGEAEPGDLRGVASAPALHASCPPLEQQAAQQAAPAPRLGLKRPCSAMDGCYAPARSPGHMDARMRSDGPLLPDQLPLGHAMAAPPAAHAPAALAAHAIPPAAHAVSPVLHAAPVAATAAGAASPPALEGGAGERSRHACNLQPVGTHVATLMGGGGGTARLPDPPPCPASGCLTRRLPGAALVSLLPAPPQAGTRPARPANRAPACIPPPCRRLGAGTAAGRPVAPG
jgi:hypothetical protein